MTSNTIVATKKFTIDLTKAELDSIHKQFLEEMDEMLKKSYCNTIVRDNVTIILTLKNKNKNKNRF